MHARVWAKTNLPRLVVSVCGSARHMILGDAKVVEAVFDLDQRVEVREHFELLSG